MTFADKTTNIYRITKEKYDKRLQSSIIGKYKKANKNIYTKIKKKGQPISVENDIIKLM